MKCKIYIIHTYNFNQNQNNLNKNFKKIIILNLYILISINAINKKTDRQVQSACLNASTLKINLGTIMILDLLYSLIVCLVVSRK